MMDREQEADEIWASLSCTQKRKLLKLSHGNDDNDAKPPQLCITLPIDMWQIIYSLSKFESNSLGALVCVCREFKHAFPPPIDVLDRKYTRIPWIRRLLFILHERKETVRQRNFFQIDERALGDTTKRYGYILSGDIDFANGGRASFSNEIIFCKVTGIVYSTNAATTPVTFLWDPLIRLFITTSGRMSATVDLSPEAKTLLKARRKDMAAVHQQATTKHRVKTSQLVWMPCRLDNLFDDYKEHAKSNPNRPWETYPFADGTLPTSNTL